MQVCRSLKLFGRGSLLKACSCVKCSSLDVVFVLYTVCASICLCYHLNGADTGFFDLSTSDDTG